MYLISDLILLRKNIKKLFINSHLFASINCDLHIKI